MTRRILHLLAHSLRTPGLEPEPHFHQGPESTPAVCHDARCPNPRLHVGDA